MFKNKKAAVNVDWMFDNFWWILVAIILIIAVGFLIKWIFNLGV